MNRSVLRAFIAIYPTQKALSELRKQCNLLPNESLDESLRWLPSKNWHITLKFLGNVDRHQLDHLNKPLNCWLTKQSAVEIQLTSIGWFPNRRKASVLAAVAEDNCHLNHLEMGVNRLVTGQKDAIEDKPFRPHLSLARCRQKPPQITDTIFPLSISPITFTATQVDLVWSQTFPEGAVYTKLASYPLLT